MLITDDKACTKLISRFLSYSTLSRSNRLFVLSFDSEAGRIKHTGYLPTVEIIDCNIMIHGRNLFDQLVKTDIRTYEDIRKIVTGQGDDNTTVCVLDYSHYKLIAIDLSQQEALDADPKAIQQIDFIANLDCVGDTYIMFILEEVKEAILNFSQRVVRVL